MAKNLIPEIAKLLGVEVGEEFKVKGDDEQTYRFDADGLKVIYSCLRKKRGAFANAMLGSLLAGEEEIVKIPWKPKKGDGYYTFEIFRGKWVVRSLWWTGAPCTYALLDKGWVFRTKEEAEDALTKVAAEMGVEYEI